MNKNVSIVIVAILIILVLGVGAYIILNNNNNDNNNGGTEKTIDIDTIGQTLANSTPFNEMATMDITTEELSSIYGINTENVERVVGKMPMMNVQASMYVLIQAKDGTVETVRDELDKYAQQYEEQWSTYLPEQYELVKNRKMGTVGNVVYMIVSENAETLEQEIIK